MRRYLVGFASVVAGLVAAVTSTAEPYEPARGTTERRAVLDAVRPMAEDGLGAPVEFVVTHMRVDGPRAFVILRAQRPGGVLIVIEETPLVLRDGEPPSLIDGPDVIAFLVQRDGAWVLDTDRHGIGATDVWWAGEPFCDGFGYRSVMPDWACPAT